MSSQIRVLIDYATGENWEMPKELYEQYLTEQCKKYRFTSHSETFIQQWIQKLSDGERLQIIKKTNTGKKIY